MNQTYSTSFPAYRDALPPEVGKSGWGVYKSVPWSAVDAYGYGCLLTELFRGSPPTPGRLPDVGNIPSNMQQVCKRLLNANPRMRPSLSQVLDQGRKQGGYFCSSLIDLSENIDSLGLKSEAEREEFLRCVTLASSKGFDLISMPQRTKRHCSNFSRGLP